MQMKATEQYCGTVYYAVQGGANLSLWMKPEELSSCAVCFTISRKVIVFYSCFSRVLSPLSVDQHFKIIR